MNDPFMPTFGKAPLLFLNRKELIDNYIYELTYSNELNTPYQTTMISGVRGLGKTAMLSEIETQISQLDDWIVIDLRNTDDIVDQLISILRHESKVNLRSIDLQLKRIRTKHFDFELNTKTTENTIMLEGILKQLQKKHIKVLIGIDEAASTPALRDFALLYQQMIRKSYGIALLMSGLPEDITELQHNKVLTFLLRSEKIKLPFLDRNSVERSFIKYFMDGGRKIDVLIAHELANMTLGHAYAFQLLGHILWRETKPGDSINRELIDRIKNRYITVLKQNVYQIIYAKLTQPDRDFLQGMSQVEQSPVRISDAVKYTKHPSNYWSAYRQRLIDFQLIRQTSRGFVSFCLPYFREFMQSEKELQEGADWQS